MRVIFAGTPAFAARALEKLVAAGYQVVLVLSQPDRPAGRGRKLKASEVKETALAHGIPVLTPRTLRASKGLAETQEALEAMRAAKADVLVVAAYGLILPQEVLDIPSGVDPERFPGLKAVNIHGSLLPAWRGAAPAARSLEAGDKETGITIMQMDAGLDTGPMLYRRGFPITEADTGGTLTEKLAELGAEMLTEYLEDPKRYPPVPQPEGATYAHKLSKTEGRIDWTMSADAISRKVRAFDPFPGCFCECRGEPLKIWFAAPVDRTTDKAPGTVLEAGPKGVLAACGGGSVIALTTLQRAGGKRLGAREFLQGHPISAGEVLQ